LAAKGATTTVPIVMAVVIDPVRVGLIASLARPGGNVTGMSWLGAELHAKRLELFKEAVPLISRVAVLSNPANPAHTVAVRGMQAAAASLGLTLQFFEVAKPGDFETALDTIRKSRPDALFTVADPLTYADRTRILEFAAKSRLPASYEWKEFVDLGGLMAYGVNLPDLYRHAAIYVDKILKGAKPADLPVEQATEFELVINLKAAKALGLTIPPSLLARADQVIE
jgi:putative ABC transport system substrate-binding protein